MFFRKRRLIFARLLFVFVVSSLVFPHYLFCESDHERVQVLKETFQKDIGVSDVAAILDSVSFVENTGVVIDDHECEELAIDQLILHWKKYTATKLDMWGLKKLLKYAPKGSKEIIRHLVENHEVFNSLEQVVVSIKKNEDALYGYWDSGNVLHSDIKRFYYAAFKKWLPKINGALNSNKVALEISQFLEMAKPLATLLASFGISGILNGLVTAKMFRIPFNWRKSVLAGFKEPIRKNTLKPAFFKCEDDVGPWDFIKIFHFMNYSTVGDRYIVGKILLRKILGRVLSNKKSSDYAAIGLSAGLQALMVAWYDYSFLSRAKSAVDRIVFLHKNAKKLQHRLCEIAHIVKALKEIEKLSQSCVVLRESVVVKNIIAFLHKETVSKKVEQLLELLNSSTFNKKVSVFYSKGCLLKTHRLLKEVKAELVPLLQQIALLGGYVAITKMFKDHQNGSVRFCFVNFVDQEKPLIKLKNAWLPLIDKKEVVPNSIELGADGGASSAAVTGPNGGGKTTFMITVAVNVLLSRLGIAASEKAYMTSFEEIKTSLNPKQDISAKLSSFMAEQRRADQVYDAIVKSKGNILVLLDEPYKGTVEAESANRVYKFGKKIAKVDHCILLMATHLEKPICLADDTEGAFTNYQMGYLEQEFGKFIRTFELQKGPALWWFKDEEKRSSFIDWLCAENVDD